MLVSSQDLLFQKISAISDGISLTSPTHEHARLALWTVYEYTHDQIPA
jgi:hypothetical protein